MRDYFFIREKGKYVKIDFHDIMYVEGCKNYLKIVTPGKAYLVLLTMKKLEQLLPSWSFKRGHKSFIVSLDRISEFDSEIVYLKDKHIPIGEQYKGVLERSVLIAQGEVNEKAFPLSTYSMPLRVTKAS
ncbi:MAG TPA: LytTR family DNA-binding domain-containing protein [Chitinophagaceae bacterium]|nr:LytTR family DNA-binding domain-containing protein [Chitinophagaceae bacterium]